MEQLTCLAITQFYFPVSPLPPFTAFLPFRIFLYGPSQPLVFITFPESGVWEDYSRSCWVFWRSCVRARRIAVRPLITCYLIPFGDLEGQSSPATLRGFTDFLSGNPVSSTALSSVTSLVYSRGGKIRPTARFCK